MKNFIPTRRRLLSGTQQHIKIQRQGRRRLNHPKQNALTAFVLLCIFSNTPVGLSFHNQLVCCHDVPLKNWRLLDAAAAVTVAAVDAIPHCTLNEYMLERNVTVRPWGSSNSESVLQMYKGAAVPPAAPTSNLKMEKLVAWLEVGKTQGHNGEQHQQQLTTNIQEILPNLSHSAMARLRQWSQLTKEEKRRLEIKLAAEQRATRPVVALEHLRILYVDEHICVVNKPSGILAVPGPRRHPSLANAVFDVIRPTAIDSVDQMVVHRLDMDTSGILVFALSKQALRVLHTDFRQRRVQKSYQALLCGHFGKSSGQSLEAEINVSLERDPFRPPFMRIAQPRNDNNAQQQHTAGIPKTAAAALSNFEKFLDRAPKPSLTELHVLQYTYWQNECSLPMTRVQLVPRTGRTHQLRVHTAAGLGYPIVGDDIYGIGGASSGSARQHNADSDDTNTDVVVQRKIWDLQLPLCLHAQRLSFFHPVSGAPMVFECDPPF